LRFGVQVVLASVLLGLWLWWLQAHVPWTSVDLPRWQRILWVALGVLGSGLVYFGALLGSGLKLRQFVRR
jgi:putative peptidoglycan lipid II flippase